MTVIAAQVERLPHRMRWVQMSQSSHCRVGYRAGIPKFGRFFVLIVTALARLFRVAWSDDVCVSRMTNLKGLCRAGHAGIDRTVRRRLKVAAEERA